jgi:phage-related protein|nr:MAG TPA: tail tape measure protein [Caudoviricetes sp.]
MSRAIRKGDSMADGYLNFDTKINEKGFNDGISKLGSLGKSGLSMVSKTMTGAIAAVGTGAAAIIKSSLGVVANMEQQVGGVETLFKNSANKVIANANKAYKTAGMSANNYMETVTSFSASLLQSLGGDTAKAASYADRAIVDMSDNANKIGTNMRDIQNAYQGFAKQNYTMLDNLKLGYGGTQEEMKRLISDASKMTDVQKELGVTVDANSLSFGNIVNAISVMQKQMGIAGTTSKEAATTIEGSVNSAKAAWENFEAGVISANDLVDAFWTAAQNIFTNLGQIIPRLGKTGIDVVSALAGKIGGAVPQVKGFTDAIESIADKLGGMDTGQLTNLGKMSAVLIGAVPAFSLIGKSAGTFSDILGGLGDVTGGAITAIGKFPDGLKNAKGAITGFGGSLKNLGSSIVGPFQVLTPKLYSVIGKTFSFLPTKISEYVGKIGPALAGKFPKITSAFQDFGGYIGSWGGQIGTAFQGVLGKVAGFMPAFANLMGFGAVLGVVAVGLGLLYSQFGTQIDQLLLLAQTKGPEVITNFANGITAALPGLVAQGATLIMGILNAITVNLPALITAGVSIISTLASSLAAQLPQLIPCAVQMIVTLVTSLVSNLPQLISSGLKLMQGLAEGIANSIPIVASKAPVIIGKLVSTIITNLPQILTTGVQIVSKLAVGLVQGIPALIGKIPSMIRQIKSAFSNVNWGSVGLNIVKGIASGLAGAAGVIMDAARSAANKALKAAKNALDIHSPSRVFRDQVGKMMALGMGAGFEKNIPIRSMNIGAQKAVAGLQKSVNFALSSRPEDNTVQKINRQIDMEGSDGRKPDDSGDDSGIPIVINNTFEVDGKPLVTKTTKAVIKKIDGDKKDYEKSKGVKK